MTERYDHSPELSIDLTHLLELSKHFLKGTPEVHGSNYEPIRLPLLWLIKEEDVVFGYRNIKRDYLQEFSYQWNKGHTPEMTELEKRLAQLAEYGLRHRKIERAEVGSWAGEIDLQAYRPAELGHRRLRAIGDEVLFDFKAYRYDSEGRSKYLHERTIYSSIEGFLQFCPGGELGDALELGGHVDPTIPYKDEEDSIGRIISYFTCSNYLTDPILRTTYYLEGKKPDTR